MVMLLGMWGGREGTLGCWGCGEGGSEGRKWRGTVGKLVWWVLVLGWVF